MSDDTLRALPATGGALSAVHAPSLVKDRMNITGARRSVAGAEAVLELRAVISNGGYRVGSWSSERGSRAEVGLTRPA